MSPMSDIVLVPQSTQLLAMAVALQFVAFMTVLWRGIFGLKQLSTRRPRWPFIPLVAGTMCGVWYAWLQQDLVFGAAQGLALFLGFCLLNSSRGEQPSGGQFTGKRSERRAAEREAKRARKNGGE